MNKDKVYIGNIKYYNKEEDRVVDYLDDCILYYLGCNCYTNLEWLYDMNSFIQYYEFVLFNRKTDIIMGVNSSETSVYVDENSLEKLYDEDEKCSLNDLKEDSKKLIRKRIFNKKEK